MRYLVVVITDTVSKQFAVSELEAKRFKDSLANAKGGFLELKAMINRAENPAVLDAITHINLDRTSQIDLIELSDLQLPTSPGILPLVKPS